MLFTLAGIATGVGDLSVYHEPPVERRVEVQEPERELAIAACGVRGRPLSVPLAAGRTPCRGTRTGTQLAEVYAGEKLTLAFAIHNPT